MPPRLFTELLQHILTLSLATYDGPTERQRARHAFQLVSKDWMYASERWRELEVTAFDQIAGLASVLVCNTSEVASPAVVEQAENDAHPADVPAPKDDNPAAPAEPAGRKIRSLHISYDAGRWGSEKALVKLFALTPALASLSIDLTATPAMSVLGDGLVQALARLTHLRHFALKTGSRSPSLNVDIDVLYKLTAGWLELKSFSLDRFYVSARLPPFVGAAPLFAGHHNLRSLSLHTHQFRNVYDSLLGSLPHSLEALTINGPRVYTDPAAVRSIVDCVAPIAHNLVTLAINDSWHCTASESIPMGTFNAILLRLDRAESLSFSPVAFKTLAALAPLAMLRELRVMQGHASATQAVLGKELIALLQTAPRVRKVVVSSEVVVQWSSKQREEAVKVAALRGIALDC